MQVEVELVALVEVVVEHRRQQVVGRRDRVEVAGEVQVEQLHRDHLAVAAAGRAALDAERRAHRRLAQADHGRLPMCFIAWPRPTVVVVLPSPSGVGVIAVTTTYFAFGRSASSSIASRRILARLVAVRLEQVLADAHLRGDLWQRFGGRGAGDLEVGWERHARHLIFLSSIVVVPAARRPRPAGSASVAHRDRSTIRVRSAVRNIDRTRIGSGEYNRSVPRRHRYVPYSRLTQPLVRDNGELRPASWHEALGRAADGFRAIRDTHGGQAIGFFSCSKSTNEMNFIAQKFARVAAGTNNIDSCNRT